MNTLEAIKARRSIKHFDPKHKISEVEIKELFEMARLSPTSFNIQNWRFVYVDDKSIQGQLRAASWNQAQVEDASGVIIICADLKAAEKDPQRYWKDADQNVQEAIVPMIGKFYAGNEALQRDEAIRSCGIAAQTIMLAAKEMGYDTCPMIGFDPKKVSEIINLPKDHIVTLMITIGKATQNAKPRSGSLDLQEVLIRNRF
jgi:nitroreductase